MPRAETRTERSEVASAAEPLGRTPQSAISVALLAGMALMPVVVAVGFISDRSGAASVPGDISAMALRGVFDGDAALRVPRPARAGY